MRSGDLDMYAMNADGEGTRRLTSLQGYDGGPFFSWDGKTIVYRAYHPKTKEELREYQKLLNQNLIKPAKAGISKMSADGSNKRQVTNNGAANWAPFLHPEQPAGYFFIQSARS